MPPLTQFAYNNMIINEIIGQVSHSLVSLAINRLTTNTEARNRFKMRYEYAPILLKNGIAEKYSEKLMSILQLTEQNDYPSSETGYFGYFSFVNGGTFMQNSVAQYPFANQYTAANAIIRQPNSVSLLMTCPARTNVPLDRRQATFQALLSALDRHISLGGMFVIYTPMAIFDNCLLLSARDSSSGDHAFLQNGIVFDFQQPQIMTEEDAKKATNATMKKINSGDKW